MYYDPAETGKRIQQLRKEKGLTQEQLANQIGISDRHLRNIESGERNPSIEMLVMLSDIFGTSIDYLILGRASQEQFKKAVGAALEDLVSLVEKL